MKNINFKKEINTKKGFTLLFAVLVSVLVLSVGASVISVALKQSILSSTGRESQFAFYAANSGLECALFWDLNPDVALGVGSERVFPYQGGDSDQTAIADYAPVNCGVTNIESGAENGHAEIDWTGKMKNDTQSEFVFTMAIANNIDNGGAPDIDDFEYCAEVTVLKASTTEDGLVTTIYSQGSNSCDPDSDTRAVERGLLMKYSDR